MLKWSYWKRLTLKRLWAQILPPYTYYLDWSLFALICSKIVLLFEKTKNRLKIGKKGQFFIFLKHSRFAQIDVIKMETPIRRSFRPDSISKNQHFLDLDSVTRWLIDMSNNCQFKTMKICPIAEISCQIKISIFKILGSQIYPQRLPKAYKSG